jgi:hypothetical protein
MEQGLFQMDVLERILGPQLGAMDDQIQQAREDRQFYEETYRPLEESLAQEAQDFASPGRIEAEAGRAQADVAQAQQQNRLNAEQRLQEYGIDPSQMRSGQLDSAVQAAGLASAGTQSRLNTEATGRALRGEAINIGRGYQADIGRSYAQSVAAGQAGLQGVNQTTQTQSNAMNAAQGWYQGGNQANQQWGQNLYQQGQLNNQAFQSASAQSNAGLGGAGQFLGLAGSFFLEDGGEVPNDPTLAIPGSTDSVEAALTPGEYVLPVEVVRAKGTEYFDKMVEKYSGAPPPDEPPQAGAKQMRKGGGYIDQPYNLYAGGGNIAIPQGVPPQAQPRLYQHGGAAQALPAPVRSR